MRSFAVFASGVLILIGGLGSGSAHAQSATATIYGQVTDPQGAVIQGVKITVTNVATEVAAKTTTDAGGNYQVLSLPIGTYTVAAEHAGFAKLVTAGRTLQINQQEKMDLRLEVGALNQVVEVSGVGANVETENPTVGESVTSRPIVNLPLNGRNVLNLALLQPGVTEDNPDDNNGSGFGGVSGFSVAGGRADSITFLLDGGVNNDLLGNGVVLNPNPDAVEEFRILTSDYTAEYGRNAAGIISVVTKSGTDQFHGSLFDFARNTAFDANSYFNIQQGLPRNDLKRQQYGGTVGGPVLKNKLFFFLAYQGQRQTQSEVESQITTFTPAELNGDFSQSANGSPDPAVAAFLQANPYFQADPAKAAQAIIDPTKIDPQATTYIATGLIPTSSSGVVTSAAGSKFDTNELTGKVDYQITAKDKLSGTVGGYRSPQIDPFGRSNFQYSADVPGFGSINQTNNYFANITYTRTFSPTLLNEFRVTAERHNTLADQPNSKLPSPSDLGYGIASDLATGPPLMVFDNQLSFGADQAGPAHEAGTTYEFANTLTWVKGAHTWKFGGGYSAYQNNTLYDFFGDSNFTFIGPYANGGIGTGNSFADFLVGIPNNLFEGANARSNVRSKSTYGFAQDQWRIRKNFTVTLGLRYEYNTPKRDTAGRTFSVVPGAQSTRFPNAPLGLLFPGDAGAPSGVNFPDKNDFSPRIGFAWDPGNNGKTSIRGGFGVFYDVLKGEDNLQFNGAPPFYSAPFVGYSCLQTVNPDGSCGPGPGYPGAAPYYTQPWTSAGLPGNPFPSPVPTAGTAFVGGADIPFGGGGIYVVDPHLRTPYTYQYNLSLQREITNSITAEVNYVGSSSKGLTSLQDVNPMVLGSTNRVLNLNQSTSANDACAAQGADPSFCPLSNLLAFRNIVFANFNSLEASLTKKVANSPIGTTYFTLGYTYGHSIDNASGFRNRDNQVPAYVPETFRSNSDFDIRHRLTFSGGWDLPFNRMWAAGPKRLVGGWSLYPILSWRTGFPLSVNAGISLDPTIPGPSGAGDANLVNAVFAPGVSRLSLTNPRTSGNVYFDPNAFLCGGNPCVPSTGYGSPRNFFRGPGRTNFDLALAKNTAITERVNAEFRIEAFNLFNHAEFSNPDTNVFGNTFGQITSTDFGSGLNTLHTERILQLALRLTF